MLKHVLAITTLATLLATGAHAQNEPAAEPGATAPGPTVGQESPAVEGGVTSPPEVVEDAAPGTMDAETASPTEEFTPGMMEAETASPTTDPMTSTVPGEWGPVDLGSISSDDLIGADIINYQDETIASIEGVIITDDGSVESLVARFGGFLGFGADRVLLTLDEIEVIKGTDEDVLVRTNLTPESIETRPTYEG